MELLFSHGSETLTFGTSYRYVDVTFESPFVSFSPNIPFGGNRQVKGGSTIAGLPKHQLKRWDMNDALSVRAELPRYRSIVMMKRMSTKKCHLMGSLICM
ncbi:MAG: hypothetical protein ACI9C4_001996 [Paraglaciecola sp.]|jgi:hypothetical protein